MQISSFANAVVARRSAGFFILWVIVAGLDPADVLAGAVASIVTAIVSVSLCPPMTARIDGLALTRLTIRFLRQSVAAGLDVAWRAFHPALPLHPGFVVHRTRLSGRSREAFRTMTSLLPGTLPVAANDDGTILVHCLDTRLPIAAQLAEEEALFSRAVRSEP